MRISLSKLLNHLLQMPSYHPEGVLNQPLRLKSSTTIIIPGHTAVT